jgi:hypothetical protein
MVDAGGDDSESYCLEIFSQSLLSVTPTPYIKSMKSIAPFLLLAVIILLLVIRRSVKSSSTQEARPDFIEKASKSRFIDDGAGIVIVPKAPEGVDYNYDVVGESFSRDGLLALVRSHKAFDTGEIYGSAVLELEPTNEFDPTAVKVVVEGVHVGYIPKFDSPAVTEMIKKRGKKEIEVPVRIGFDTNSPEPLIGVKLALTVE